MQSRPASRLISLPAVAVCSSWFTTPWAMCGRNHQTTGGGVASDRLARALVILSVLVPAVALIGPDLLLEVVPVGHPSMMSCSALAGSPSGSGRRASCAAMSYHAPFEHRGVDHGTEGHRSGI